VQARQRLGGERPGQWEKRRARYVLAPRLQLAPLPAMPPASDGWAA